MAIRKMKMLAWQKATAAALGKPSWQALNGRSPGGVADELGVSRQAIHNAVHRGQLDAVLVVDDRTEELRLFMIPEPSLEAYKARREQRRRA